jgi:hypothetical protein
VKPRLLLYILVALAGAACLYGGLKIHRDIFDDGATHKESLTIGLASSPLYTQIKSVRQTGNTESSPPDSVPPSTSDSLSITASWHPISGSTLLAALGLALLLAAGRLRKNS